MTFVNKASWPFSIQPHGVSYGKAWEGMRYHDGLCLLFLSNSKLMLVVELCSPYPSVLGGSAARKGRMSRGWKPAWSSEPARGLAQGHEDVSAELVAREGARGRTVPEVLCFTGELQTRAQTASSCLGPCGQRNMPSAQQLRKPRASNVHDWIHCYLPSRCPSLPRRGGVYTILRASSCVLTNTTTSRFRGVGCFSDMSEVKRSVNAAGEI